MPPFRPAPDSPLAALLDASDSVLTASEREGVAQLVRRLAALDGLRPDRARVGILGAFKAGKSSLINALVGREIAATDDLELTAAVTIFSTASVETGVIVQRESGAETTLSYDDYVRRASTVRSDPGWWADVVSCEVPCGADLALSIVDTPGTGATTVGRTRRAREALQLCDAVVWVLAADNLGEASEAALLREVHASGMPTLVVANKVDLLSPEETDDVRAWIETTFPWGKGKTYFVSAKEAAAGNPSPEFRTFRSHVSEDVAKDRHGLRARAIDAGHEILAREMGALAASVIERLSPIVARTDRDLQVLSRRGEQVRSRIVERLRARVNAEFLSAIEQELLASKMTPDDMAQRINQEFASEQTRSFWGNFAASLPGEMLQGWEDALADVEVKLREAFEPLAQEFVAQVGTALQASVEKSDESLTARDVRDAALVGGAAIGGASVAAIASTAITFGAALSVIALPVGLAGVGILAVRRLATNASDNDRRRETVLALITEARTRVWTNFVEPHVLPRVDEVHDELLLRTRRQLGGSEYEAAKRLLAALGHSDVQSGGTKLLTKG